MNFGFYSYLGAAIAYGLFSILLLISWSRSAQGRFLAIVATVSALWCIFATQVPLGAPATLTTYQVLEVFRYIAWYALKRTAVAIHIG